MWQFFEGPIEELLKRVEVFLFLRNLFVITNGTILIKNRNKYNIKKHKLGLYFIIFINGFDGISQHKPLVGPGSGETLWIWIQIQGIASKCAVFTGEKTSAGDGNSRDWSREVEDGDPFLWGKGCNRYPHIVSCYFYTDTYAGIPVPYILHCTVVLEWSFHLLFSC